MPTLDRVLVSPGRLCRWCGERIKLQQEQVEVRKPEGPWEPMHFACLYAATKDKERGWFGVMDDWRK